MGLFDTLGTGQEGDLLANPLFRIGMNLMARGGPQKAPHSVGQDVAGSLQDFQQQKEGDTESQMKLLQLKMLQDQLDRKKKYQDDYDNFLTQMNGGGDQASSPAAAVPTATGMTPPSASPSGLPSGPPTQLVPPRPVQGPSPFPSGLSGSGLGDGTPGFNLPAPPGPVVQPSAPQPQQLGQLGPDYTPKVAKFEGGAQGYTAQSQNSSARGRYQFTQDTYNQFAPLAGVKPDDWSPQAQDRVFEAFTKANVGNLQMAGLPVDNGSTYAMHLLGSGDGLKFVKAFVQDPNTPLAAVGLSSPKVLSNNPQIFGSAKTVGDAMEAIQSKVFDAGAPGPQNTAQASAQSNTQTQPDAPQGIMGTVMAAAGMPANKLKQLKAAAYLASGGDVDQFHAIFAKGVEQYMADQEKDTEPLGQPFNAGGRTFILQKNGQAKDITDQLGGQRTGMTFGNQAPDLDHLTPDQQATYDYAAEMYRKTGKLPSARSGLQAGTIAWAARQAKQEGHDAVFDIATQMGLKADQTSLNRISTLGDSVKQFEGTMIRNMKVVEDTMPGGIGESMPFINRWVQYGKTEFGDEKVPAYTTALLTVMDEYAKVLAGASGGSMTTDAARAQAVSMLRPDMTKDQVLNVFNTVIRPDADNRVNSVNATKADIVDRINARGHASTLDQVANPTGTTSTTTPTPMPAAKPPAGVTKAWVLKDGKLVPAP